MSRAKGKRGMPARSPSLESSASVASAPTARVTARKGQEDPGHVHSYGSHLFDCCALLVYCPKHKTFCLEKINAHKGYFLPWASLRNTEGWYVAAIGRLKQLLSVGSGPRNYCSFSPPEMLHLFRLQVPNVHKFVSRITYFSQLTHEEKYASNCCQASAKVQWAPAADVAHGQIGDVWGPEPSVFGDAFLEKTVDRGGYTEFTLRETLKYSPRDPPKTFQDELVASAKFSERDIIKIYAEYIQHCYPSQYMSYSSFADYMGKLGWSSNDMDLTATYRACGFNFRGYLSYHEFVLGMAAMQKSTQHGGHPGELRCGYIFRFYDANGDGALDRSEMVNLTTDILKLKGKPADKQAVEKEIETNCGMLKVGVNEPISQQQFMRGVGTMAFRGSSALFRCNFNLMAQISLKRCYDSVSLLQSTLNLDAGGAKKPRGTCARCRVKKYHLAVHTVRLSMDGIIVDPQVLTQDDIAKMPAEKRQQSKIEFSGDNAANKIIDWIKEYAIFAIIDERARTKQLRGKRGPNFWVQSDRKPLAQLIVKFLSDVESVVRRENRVVKVNSPCYVLGDLHGNLHDLLIYERTLWSKGPVCNESTFLFLGDYVDRGDNGLEVVLYLFACKVLNPDKYVLLRGNHELRPIQSVFTFRKECLEKFTQEFGTLIWETCNKIFDILPLCGVIDESIFCAHGGIPTSTVKVEELNNIPSPLPDPENQSSAAWEMLWNDPISGNEFGEYLEMLRLQSGSNAFSNLQGFLPNTKRGTAYYFSDEAVNKFLTSNNLSHIIRAHEVIPPGYQFHMGGRVITVFSSSRYCNGINEAACVWVDQEKIRIMRLETATV